MDAVSYTFAAQPAEPFVHLDNRALVLSNGAESAMFFGNALPFVAESLDILAQEGRATRRHGATVLGGFRSDDGSMTLFGGAVDRLVSLSVDARAFDELRAAVTRQVRAGVQLP
jgi:hypothetical protein